MEFIFYTGSVSGFVEYGNSYFPINDLKLTIKTGGRRLDHQKTLARYFNNRM